MKKPQKKPTKDLTVDIMSAIKKGEVTMRPKAYFVIGSLLLGAGLAIAFTLAFFFLTASAFHLRNAGSVDFLKYGGMGALFFVRMFPWKPLLLAVFGIMGGLWFLKKYDVSYKKNFWLVSLALVGALLVFAVVFDRLGANDRLEKVKRFEPLYRQEFDRGHAVRGKIIIVKDSSLVVEERRERQTIEIVWDEKTVFPTGKDFVIGEEVVAIGERESFIFKAKGIHQAQSPRMLRIKNLLKEK